MNSNFKTNIIMKWIKWIICILSSVTTIFISITHNILEAQKCNFLKNEGDEKFDPKAARLIRCFFFIKVVITQIQFFKNCKWRNSNCMFSFNLSTKIIFNLFLCVRELFVVKWQQNHHLCRWRRISCWNKCVTEVVMHSPLCR